MAGGILGNGVDIIEYIKGAIDVVGDKFNAGLGLAKDAVNGALIALSPASDEPALTIHAPQVTSPLTESFNSIESHHIEAALAAIHPATRSYDEPHHAMQDMSNGMTMKLPTPSGIPNDAPPIQLQGGFSFV